MKRGHPTIGVGWAQRPVKGSASGVPCQPVPRAAANPPGSLRRRAHRVKVLRPLRGDSITLGSALLKDEQRCQRDLPVARSGQFLRLKLAVADEPHNVLAREPQPIRGLLGREPLGTDRHPARQSFGNTGFALYARGARPKDESRSSLTLSHICLNDADHCSRRLARSPPALRGPLSRGRLQGRQRRWRIPPELLPRTLHGRAHGRRGAHRLGRSARGRGAQAERRATQSPRRPMTWGTVRSMILMSVHSDQLAT